VTDARHALEIRDISVALSGVEILHGVSAAARRGSLLGLVGPNGAGKSTLLRAVAGLIPVTTGDVALDGADLHALSRREIARAACLLPQNAAVTFPFRAREVVAMGRNPHLGRFEPFTDADAAVVDAAMHETGVTEFAERPTTELSGGERQRVLLARSLATQAPILLLDEPTTSLDILHQLEVLDLLRRFAEAGRTVVASLHDLNLARRACSRVLLLDHGRVVAEGPAAETLSTEHIEAVFGVRVAERREPAMVFDLPGGNG
jgi:iron complex transport system ATP-binding protein